MKYRPEIDGLRCLAVVPVLLFHGDERWCPGGYVGVDVFFVISGFLITSIIRRELAEGRFSLANFFDRRIRRILPAMLVMLALTAIAACLLILPSALRGFGRSLAAAALSCSNVLFFLEDGYFDGPSDFKPLLHTWSLGLEEQFYLVVPLLLIALHRWRPGWTRAVLIAIGLLSFGLAEWLIATGRSSQAFFLLHARAWELMLGSVLAYAPVDPAALSERKRRVITALPAIGLLLILASYAGLDFESRFPGRAALPCCVGTALILWTPIDNGVFRLLSLQPLVWIGKISYSLYLYHWPILVLAGIAAIEPLAESTRAMLLVASVGAAWLSYRFVEQPMRHGGAIGRRVGRFVSAAAAVAVFAAFGAAMHLSDGLPQRVPTDVLALDAGGRLTRDDFPHRELDAGGVLFGPEQTPPSLAVVGDSHARVVAHGIAHAALAGLPDDPQSRWRREVDAADLLDADLLAKLRGRSVAAFVRSGTAPLLDVRLMAAAGDGESDNAQPLADQLDVVCGMSDVRSVLIVSRWAIHLQGYASEMGPSDRRRSAASRIIATDGRFPVSHDEAADIAAAGLARTVDRLQACGKRVFLLDPIPEVGYHVPRTLAAMSWRGRDWERFTRPAAMYESRQRRSRRVLAAAGDAVRIDPTGLFFASDTAVVHRDGVPLYFDDNHLSLAAAVRLLPMLDAAGVFDPADAAASGQAADGRTE